MALDCRATATSTVGVCSTARRRRNQEVSEMRRAVAGGVSPRSSATSAEAAALDQQVGRFERVLGVVAAAHPKQALQAHAGGGGGSGIEGVFGIHQRADFLPRRGLRQDGKQQAGAAGGSRAEDFGEAAARQSAGGGIDLGNAGGDAFGRGRACQSRWPPRTDSNCV